MLYIIVTICFIAILLSTGNSSPIMGGRDVAEISKEGEHVRVIGQNKYPYMAELIIFETTEKKQTISNCGGVIISTYAVLTAAHCLADCITDPDVFVKAGFVHSEYQKKLAQASQMQSYIIHDGYVDECKIITDFSEFCLNDIAILFLKKPFVFGNTISKANMAGPTDSHSNKNGFIIGWSINEKGESMKMLQEAEMRTVPLPDCQKLHPYVMITSNMICVQSVNKAAGSCEGDSGGPFIIDGKVYGISSFNTVIEDDDDSHEICDPTIPMVYTNVALYTIWITETLRKYPKMAKSETHFRPTSPTRTGTGVFSVLKTSKTAQKGLSKKTTKKNIG